MIPTENNESHTQQHQTGYPPVFTAEEDFHNDIYQAFDDEIQHNLQNGLPPRKTGASTMTVRGSR